MNSTEQIVQAWKQWTQDPRDEFLLTGELLQAARTLGTNAELPPSDDLKRFIELSDEREWEQATELLSQPSQAAPAPSAQQRTPKISTTNLKTSHLLEAIQAIGTHLELHQSVPDDVSNLLCEALENARERGFIALGMGGIGELAISPNNQWSAVACEKGVALLLDRAGRIRHHWQACEFAELRSIAFDPSGHSIVTGGSDGSVKLWTLEGKQIGSMNCSHEGAVLSVAVSPDGDSIASSGTDLAVHIWPITDSRETTTPTLDVEATSQTCGYHLNGHQTLIRTLQFDPLGRWLLGGGSDGHIYVWDWHSGRLERTFDTRMSAITSLSIDSDGQRLVCGSRDGEVWVQHMETGTQNRWQAAKHPIAAAMPLSDEDVISSGGRSGSIQWKQDGQMQRRLKGEDKDSVTAAAVSPFGDWMVCGTRAGLIRLWDLRKVPRVQSKTDPGKSPSPPSSWQHWLNLACDRLQYHPALTETQSAVARQASKVCSLYGYQDRGATIPLQH